MVLRKLVELHSLVRDNKFLFDKELSETEISRKANFTRVTEAVESCQMCWDLNQMQRICNKDYDMYRTFFSTNAGKCPFLI